MEPNISLTWSREKYLCLLECAWNRPAKMVMIAIFKLWFFSMISDQILIRKLLCWPATLLALRAEAARQLGRHTAAWATLVWIIRHMFDAWHSHFLPACIWQTAGRTPVQKQSWEGFSCWYRDRKKNKIKNPFPLCCLLSSKLGGYEQF